MNKKKQFFTRLYKKCKKCEKCEKSSLPLQSTKVDPVSPRLIDSSSAKSPPCPKKKTDSGNWRKLTGSENLRLKMYLMKEGLPPPLSYPRRSAIRVRSATWATTATRPQSATRAQSAPLPLKKTCEKCGTSIIGNGKFCSRCGTQQVYEGEHALDPTMRGPAIKNFCGNCGKIKSGLFCGNCGKKHGGGIKNKKSKVKKQKNKKVQKVQKVQKVKSKKYKKYKNENIIYI